VVGPGNADVRVNVELNPATRERTEELYEPSKTALRSEHKVEEQNGGTEAGVAGVPGARTNLPDAQEGAVAEETPPAAGGGMRRSQTRNWEVQRITQKTNTPPGEIRRLSVAVVLNGRYEQRGEKPVFVPRGADEVKDLEAVVRRAVGFSAERGDEVEVRAVRFAHLDADAPEHTDKLILIRRWLPVALVGLLAIAVLSAIVIVGRGTRAQRPAARLAAAATAARLAGGAAAPSAALPGAEARALLVDDSVDAEKIRGRALELAAKDPATAAVVLRQWLGGTQAVATRSE
jgi:flagellar M-ring protein FliF